MDKKLDLFGGVYIPDGVLSLLFDFFERKELVAAACVAKWLRQYALSNRYWKNIYRTRFRKKLEQPRPSLLGDPSMSYYRAYIQAGFGKRIQKQGSFLCFASGSVVHSGCPKSQSVCSLYILQGNSIAVSVIADGRIKVYQLMNGELLLGIDTQEKARILHDEFKLLIKRNQLATPHKNKLMNLKTEKYRYEGTDFDLYPATTENKDTDIRCPISRSSNVFSPTVGDCLSVSPLTPFNLNLELDKGESVKTRLDKSYIRAVSSSPGKQPVKMKRGVLISKNRSKAIPIGKSKYGKRLNRKNLVLEKRPMAIATSTSPDLSSDSEAETKSLSSFGSYQENSSIVSGSMGSVFSSSLESEGSVEQRGKNGKGRKKNSQGKREHVQKGISADVLLSFKIDDSCVAGFTSYQNRISLFAVCSTRETVFQGAHARPSLEYSQGMLRVQSWANKGVHSSLVSASFFKISGLELSHILDSANENKNDRSDSVYSRKLLAATGHHAGIVCLWNHNLEFSHCIRMCRPHVAVTTVHAEESFLVCGNEKGLIQTWEPASSAKLGDVKARNSAVFNVKVLSDLIIGCYMDGTLCISRRNCRLLRIVMVLSCGPFSIACTTSLSSPKIVTIATCGTGNEIKVWKLDSRSEFTIHTATFNGHTDRITSLHIDSHRLISSSNDGTIKAWEVEHAQGKLLRTFKAKGKSGKCGVTTQAILPNSVIGGRFDGSIFAFDFSPRQTQTDSNSKKVQNKKNGRARSRRYGRRPNVFVGKETYMDVLYDDEYDTYY